MSPSVVQSIVGHGSPALTKHYPHMSEDVLKNAINTLPVLNAKNISSKEMLLSMTSENWEEVRDKIVRNI